MRGHESAHHRARSPLSRQVIAYRYRDDHEDIRAACIPSLGRVLHMLPSFCDDKHLKYMGWQLSNIQSAAVRLAFTLQASARMHVLTTAPLSPNCTPQVRLASLQALGHVYKAFDEIKDLTPVRHFTERFESRLLSMIKDVDDGVAVEATRLVTRLQACHLPCSAPDCACRYLNHLSRRLQEVWPPPVLLIASDGPSNCLTECTSDRRSSAYSSPLRRRHGRRSCASATYSRSSGRPSDPSSSSRYVDCMRRTCLACKCSPQRSCLPTPPQGRLAHGN